MHNGCFPAVCVIRAELSLYGLDDISMLAMEVSDYRFDDNSGVWERENLRCAQNTTILYAHVCVVFPLEICCV